MSLDIHVTHTHAIKKFTNFHIISHHLHQHCPHPVYIEFFHVVTALTLMTMILLQVIYDLSVII